MVARLRARLSYANVVATLALFIALGGSSYAALKLPRNSVGSAQLRRNAVGSTKVKDGSLLLRDFKRSQRTLLRGPTGPQGLPGAPGAAGAKGDPGATNVVVRTQAFRSTAPDKLTQGSVMCHPGEHATGGGGGSIGLGSAPALVLSVPLRADSQPNALRFPDDGEAAAGWLAVNHSVSTGDLDVVFVLCAQP